MTEFLFLGELNPLSVQIPFRPLNIKYAVLSVHIFTHKFAFQHQHDNSDISPRHHREELMHSKWRSVD